MIARILRAASPLLVALSMISGKADAATEIYNLEANNLSQFAGQTLARVTLMDVTGGVDFTVEALIPGSKLAQFGFNFLDDTQPGGFSISGLPAAWLSVVDINNRGGFNGFGKFDVDVYDGGNSGRLTPLTFSVSGGTVENYVALSSSNGPEVSLFSAHVTNLDISGSGSCDGMGGCEAVTGYAGGGTLVPIPAAVWLFGSGLLGLAGIARRKKN